MIKFLSSGPLTGILLLISAIALAAATFIENGMSSQAAKTIVYHNPLFFVLLALLCVNLMLSMTKYLSRHRFGIALLHLSFVIIIAGAGITHFFSREGLLHIRQGEKENILVDNSGNKVGELPFEVKLEQFRMGRYSELGSPSSYESDIDIDGKKYTIAMNRFAKYRGYRLYQASYDKDLQGTVLSVNHDPWGIAVTYLGYILMVLGFVWAACEKGSRFRQLLSRASAIALFLLPIGSFAQDIGKEALEYSIRYAVPDSIADRFGRLTMQTPEGRLQPIDTYSADILQKLSKKRSFNGLDANQILLGICTQQPIWSYVPFIRIGDDYLAGMLSVEKGNRYASYADAFDSSGNYLLEETVRKIYSKDPKQRTASDKEIMKFDERLNIMSALMSGNMMPIFPLKGSTQWYSPSDDLSAFQSMDSMFVTNSMLYLSSTLSGEKPNFSKASELIGTIDLYQKKMSATLAKTDAEILYNRLNAVRICGFGFMTAGILLILTVIAMMFRFGEKNILYTVLTIVSWILLAFLTFSLGLRWYISGNAPWSNAYESIVYVGWATALIALVMKSRSRIIYSLSIFFAGAILFVSSLSFMDPQITPLVPVLKSNWLIIHVATITASYGFFAICFLIGITTLVLTIFSPKNSEIEKLTSSNELLMWIGLALMTIGTFLGAVWANQSWGRYWGWDPKETWALITVIVYALVLHSRHIFSGRSSTQFAIMSVFALGAVLMTFFGVNYYLTGLHSYAGGSSPVGLKAIWISYAVISVLSIVAVIREKR